MDEMEQQQQQGRYNRIYGVHVRYKPALTGRVVLGLTMVAFGILWTLDNLGVVDSQPILKWWPAIIIVFGTTKLLGLGSRPNVFVGGLGLLVGGWLLAEQFDLIHLSFFALWPVVFILFGIAMLTRSTMMRRSDPTQLEDHDSKLTAMALLSGVVRKVTSTEFRGGDATAMMGGVKLDLRGAKPVPGGAVVDVMVMWGGVEIVVPDTWRVVNEATVMLGGLEDRTKVPPADARDILIIRGFVMMGGVELKN